jgi:outer membrane protein assembly factor BamB
LYRGVYETYVISNPSRRRILAVCGTLVGSLSVGQMLTTGSTESKAANRSTNSNWPMEQHDPGGTSYAPDASPPKDGVRVRWKQQVKTHLGFAYRPTPVVANGLVYGVGEELICADAASGEVVFRTDRSYFGPPAVADARAYQSPTLAFATQTGAVGLNARGGFSFAGVRIGLTRWQTGRKKGGFSFFGGGLPRTIPVAANGTVLITSGTGLRAIDASSGRIRWRSHNGRHRPAVHEGVVYVAAFGNGVFGYDIETGEQTFSVQPPEQLPLSVTATPDHLVVGTSSGLLGIDYDETAVWRYTPEDLDRDGGGVAVANGIAYAGFIGQPDRLVAIDTTNGTELWRSEVAPEETPRFAPPSVADGVVYIPTEDEGLAAIDAKDGHVRWRFTLNNPVRPWSPPALVGKTLYALGNDHLYALEEK